MANAELTTTEALTGLQLTQRIRMELLCPTFKDASTIVFHRQNVRQLGYHLRSGNACSTKKDLTLRVHTGRCTTILFAMQKVLYF